MKTIINDNKRKIAVLQENLRKIKATVTSSINDAEKLTRIAELMDLLRILRDHKPGAKKTYYDQLAEGLFTGKDFPKLQEPLYQTPLQLVIYAAISKKASFDEFIVALEKYIIPGAPAYVQERYPHREDFTVEDNKERIITFQSLHNELKANRAQMPNGTESTKLYTTMFNNRLFSLINENEDFISYVNTLFADEEVSELFRSNAIKRRYYLFKYLYDFYNEIRKDLLTFSSEKRKNIEHNFFKKSNQIKEFENAYISLSKLYNRNACLKLEQDECLVFSEIIGEYTNFLEELINKSDCYSFSEKQHIISEIFTDNRYTKSVWRQLKTICHSSKTLLFHSLTPAKFAQYFGDEFEDDYEILDRLLSCVGFASSYSAQEFIDDMSETLEDCSITDEVLIAIDDAYISKNKDIAKIIPSQYSVFFKVWLAVKNEILFGRISALRIVSNIDSKQSSYNQTELLAMLTLTALIFKDDSDKLFESLFINETDNDIRRNILSNEIKSKLNNGTKIEDAVTKYVNGFFRKNGLPREKCIEFFEMVIRNKLLYYFLKHDSLSYYEGIDIYELINDMEYMYFVKIYPDGLSESERTTLAERIKLYFDNIPTYFLTYEDASE